MSSQQPQSHDPDPASTRTTVRLWAAARAAAGTDEIVLDEARTVAAAVTTLGARVPALAPILAVSSLLIGGRRVASEDVIAPGDVLEVLPPFAGG